MIVLIFSDSSFHCLAFVKYQSTLGFMLLFVMLCYFNLPRMWRNRLCSTLRYRQKQAGPPIRQDPTKIVSEIFSVSFLRVLRLIKAGSTELCIAQQRRQIPEVNRR